MSASTQFNLKKVAAGVINSVEKTLAVVAGDEELMAYGASTPPSPQLERMNSGTGMRREKAESVTGRSAGKEQGAGTTTTLLRQRSVRSEGGGGGARTTKAKRS